MSQSLIETFPLFVIDDESMKFHLVDLNNELLQNYTEVIEQCGGEVIDDDECLVKFTTKKGYRPNAYPRATIYNVRFIAECVKEKRLVNPEKYRFGSNYQRDRCIIGHFLQGCCYCRRMKNKHTVADFSQNSSPTPSFVSTGSSAHEACVKMEHDDDTLIDVTNVENKFPSPSFDESQLMKLEFSRKNFPPDKEPMSIELADDEQPIITVEKSPMTKALRKRRVMCSTQPLDDLTTMENTRLQVNTQNTQNTIFRKKTKNSREELADAASSTLDQDDISRSPAKDREPKLDADSKTQKINSEISKKQLDKEDKWIVSKKAQNKPPTKENREQIHRMSQNTELYDSEVSLKKNKILRKRSRDSINVESDGNQRNKENSIEFLLEKMGRENNEFEFVDLSALPNLNSTDCDSTSSEISRDETTSKNTRDYEFLNEPGPSGIANKSNTLSRLQVEKSRLASKSKSTSRSSDDQLEEPSQHTRHSGPRVLSPLQSETDSFEFESEDEEKKIKPRKLLQVTQTRNNQYRRPFEAWERREMIHFLIENRKISAATDCDTWKKMMSEGKLTHRTYESLRNQFRRGILPFIEEAHLDQMNLDIFLRLREKIGATSTHKPSRSSIPRF